MVGQGSVNHNSRAFNAKNTDRSRSHLNITYCHENIKTVFHELFDEARNGYNHSRPGQTAKSRTTMKRYVPASRKSRSMKSSCKWAIRTT